jgi:hypothetical protein
MITTAIEIFKFINKHPRDSDIGELKVQLDC